MAANLRDRTRALRERCGLLSRTPRRGECLVRPETGFGSGWLGEPGAWAVAGHAEVVLRSTSPSPAATAAFASSGSPEVISRSAAAAPISRGARCVPPLPGSRPSFTSGRPSFAHGPSTRAVQAIADLEPTAERRGSGSRTDRLAAAISSAATSSASVGGTGGLPEFRDVGAGDDGPPLRRDHRRERRHPLRLPHRLERAPPQRGGQRIDRRAVDGGERNALATSTRTDRPCGVPSSFLPRPPMVQCPTPVKQPARSPPCPCRPPSRAASRCP
jgi:hypothetical protein